MVNAETWHDIEDRAVWLYHDVYAWVLSSPPQPPDRWPSRVEKRVWLRIQRDTEGIEVTDVWPVFDDQKEVMMTHAACIQVTAADPNCTTSASSDVANIMRHHSSDVDKNLFSDSNRYNAQELEVLDRVHASACKGRWVSKAQVDYDMLKHWLWTCNVFHDKECTFPNLLDSRSRTYPSRVIDVRRGCVTLTPPHAAYACLSYVWGTKPQLQLTTKTFDTLTSEGALLNESSGLAKTIKDAIYVCSMLGQDYLWVDSVCIKQDDHSTRQAEIQNMDIIYGGAALTIIAASGSSADAGLPGARKGSRNTTQHMEVIRGRQLMASMPSPSYDADISMWERRAWTLQETALSRRRLIFTESQVYFQCKTTYFYEDAVCEIPGRVKIIGFPSTKSAWEYVLQHDFTRSDGFPKYADIVRIITKRQLSFDSDALNACAGILKVDQQRRASQGENTAFAFGLPTAIFSKAMCWMSIKDSPGRRRSEFSSWTWAGWDTAASYDLLQYKHSKIVSYYDPSMANESDDTKAAALVGPQPVGDLDLTCPLLTFWTTSALLRVERTSRWPSFPNCFAICSTHEPELWLGCVALADSARACRPDEMEFIVIGIECYDNGERPQKYSYAVKLLCIEWIGDVAQRVQIAYDTPEDGPFQTDPSKGPQSLANWRAVNPVEKLIKLG